MMNGSFTIEDLLAMIGNLRQTQGTLRKEIQGVEDEIQGIELTIRALRRTHNLPEPVQTRLNLASKSHKEAVFTIANQNGGILKVTEARRMMVAAGKFKTPKNGSAAIYSVFKRNPESWEWVAPGEYRLVGSKKV